MSACFTWPLDVPHDLAVTAILHGRAVGRVFADDPSDPHFALVSPHWGRLYVVGKANAAAVSDVRGLLEEAIRPAARVAGAHIFTLAYPPDWQPYISEVLAEKSARQFTRQVLPVDCERLPTSAGSRRFCAAAGKCASASWYSTARPGGSFGMRWLRNELSRSTIF